MTQRKLDITSGYLLIAAALHCAALTCGLALLAVPFDPAHPDSIIVAARILVVVCSLGGLAFLYVAILGKRAKAAWRAFPEAVRAHEQIIGDKLFRGANCEILFPGREFDPGRFTASQRVLCKSSSGGYYVADVECRYSGAPGFEWPDPSAPMRVSVRVCEIAEAKEILAAQGVQAYCREFGEPELA